MTAKRVVLFAGVCALLCAAITPAAQAQQRELFNTAKRKLMEGKPIVGGTVYTTDPNIYCAMANAGFDFLWIDLQFSAGIVGRESNHERVGEGPRLATEVTDVLHPHADRVDRSPRRRHIHVFVFVER